MPGRPAADVSAHVLDDAESWRIFAADIEPAELPPPTRAGAAQGESALALLVIGQTGAGKSVLSTALLDAVGRRRGGEGAAPAHLIADTFKTYHPSYARLRETAPHLASAATGPDARRWLVMAARRVAARRLDVVVESACRHPRDFEQLARVFAGAGFAVEVLVLAVPAALSRLGILLRFHARLPEGRSRGLPARLTPVAVHDESYAGLVDAAALLDRSRLADQVLVMRRGMLVACGQRRAADDGAVEAGGVEAALLAERERLTRQEADTARRHLDDLAEFEQAREPAQQLRAMLQPLMDQVQDRPGPELLPLEFARRGQADKGAFNLLRLGQQ